MLENQTTENFMVMPHRAEREDFMELPKQIELDDICATLRHSIKQEIITRYNAYDKDQQTIKDLVEACEATLEGLNNMTTTDFSLGKDKPLRNTLEQAIAKAKA